MIKKRSARLALLVCAGFASLGLLAGASPAAAKAKKKTVTKTATFNQCVSTSQRVAENSTTSAGGIGTVSFPITVPKFKGKPQDGLVTALTSAGVRITHTFDGDLVIVLVSPGGKVIPLAITRGGIGNGYGTGAQDCGGSLVLFGDGFPTPIGTPGNTGDNPITGSFMPEQPFSQVVGGPARGNWVVVVTDGGSGDQGTLDAVSLNLTYNYKAQVKKKKKKK